MKIYGDVISPFVRMTLVAAQEGASALARACEGNGDPDPGQSEVTARSPTRQDSVLETDHHHSSMTAASSSNISAMWRAIPP